MHWKVDFVTLIVVLLWTLSSFAAPEKGEMKTGPKVENAPAAKESKDFSPVESYIFVSEKNIFHPDRKDFPIVAPPPPAAGAATEVKKPVVRPQVVLHGVTISDAYEAASFATPGRVMKPGERELQTLKKGENIGDYKLAQILPDRIVLQSPEDSFEVLLYDPKVAKKRIDIKTENKPATVTSLGLATAPAPAPGTATAPVPVPVRTVAPGGAGTGAQPTAPTAGRPGVSAPAAPVPTPTPAPSTGSRRRQPVPSTLPAATPQRATE